MQYSSEEIAGAVEKIVRTSVRRAYGELGNRASSDTFSDTMDAAAGVFFSFGDAPFYVIELACSRALERVRGVKDNVVQLMGAVQSLRRHVAPVDQLSTLHNATAALNGLSSALATRDGGFDDMAESPAYQRFESNVQRFLDEVSSNILESGQIVSPPEETRGTLQTLLATISTEYQGIVRLVERLTNAIGDFEAMPLRATIQQMVVSGARSVVEERTKELEGMTPSDRLTKLRDVTLDLLAARALVAGFGALPRPMMFVPLEGTGYPTADSAHPATPAELVSRAGPFCVTTAAYQLKFLVDGTKSVTLAIQGSFPAGAQGTLPEPFYISDGAPPGTPDQNDAVVIRATGEPDVTIVMTESPAKPLENNANNGVVQEWNASLVGHPMVAEAVVFPLRWSGDVDITPDGALDADFTVTTPGVDFTGLGVTTGWWVVVQTGANAGQAYQLLAPPTPTVIKGRRMYGMVTAADPGQTIRVGPNRYLKIGVAPAWVSSALQTNQAVSFPAPTAVVTRALQTLGFFPEMQVTSRRTSAVDAVNSVLASPAASTGDTPVLRAVRTVDQSVFNGTGRTEPTSRLKYVVYWMRGRADVVSVGTTCTITPVATIPASVVVGGSIVLREAAAPADVGKVGVISNVTPTAITAVFSSAVTPATDVLVEAGPTLIVPHDCVLVISGNTLNDGEWAVTYSGGFPNAVPFELPLVAPLPASYGAGFTPIISTATVGQEHVVFRSTDVSVATALEVQNTVNSVASEFFTGLPSAVGMTNYFQLPSAPKSLSVGDVLELYGTSYNTPDSQHPIVAIESTGIVELSTGVPTNTGNVMFSTAAVLPFARVRKTRFDTYSDFQLDGDQWLDDDANQPNFFKNLLATINPLVVSSNPTLLQVGTATAELGVLMASLTNIETILDAYDSSNVPAVDALISSLLERGAERAVDMLLECRFSDFFGLTLQQSSYAGELADALRSVQRDDMPIEKTGRTDAGSRTLLAAYESPDGNYDLSDVDRTPGVDTPADTPKPYPGASF